jgi:hypothetical protein
LLIIVDKLNLSIRYFTPIKDMDSPIDDYLNEERLLYWKPYSEPKTFFKDPHIPLVELSQDLENEPYTVEDTGHRANIATKLDFNYKIDNERGKMFIKIGQKFYTGKVSDMSEEKFYLTPDKLKTNISVMDVYLNYGLNMTYSYLRHIYYNPISIIYPNWMMGYLQASLLVIDPSYVLIDIVPNINKIMVYNLYLSSLILLKLTLIDTDQPEVNLPLSRTEKDIAKDPTLDTNLKAFFTDPRLPLITLSPDLENEPYIVVYTGNRPDIRIKSGYFEYKIDNEKGKFTIKINQKIYSGNVARIFEDSMDHIPDKLKTNISIMDVYLNYGLNMTYSYLKHIYYNPISVLRPDWLFSYLQASLLVIDPSYKLEKTIISINKIMIYNLYLSSLILLKLTLIDKDQPKLLSALTEVKQELPPEVLSLIFQSKRISKSIGDITEYNRCYRKPMTMEELSNFYNHHVDYCTKFLDNQYFIQYYENEELFEYNLEILGDNGPYILIDYEEPSLTIGNITNYSISVYRKAYLYRGCNKKTINILLIKLLNELSKMKINSDNYKIACGWLIQLNFDINNIVDIELQNNIELEIALHNTVKIVINLINDGVL